MKDSNIKEVFKKDFSKKNDVELMAYTGWAIWNRRNQIRFNEASCPLNQILALSKERKVEFQRLHPIVVMPQH